MNPPETPSRLTAVSTTIIATIAVLIALYFGRVVFVPIAIAVLLAAVLRPAVERLERWRIPAPAGAAVIIAAGLAAVAIAGSFLATPVREFGKQIPAAVVAGVKRVESLREKLVPTRAHPDTLMAAGPRDSSSAAPAPAPTATSLPPLAPIAGQLFGTTTEIVAGVLETLLLLFFLLAAGGKWHEQLLVAAPTASARRRAVELVSEIRQVIGRYLGTMALINLLQGILVGLITALIGLPGPALWGLLTFALEFVPYAGSVAMIVLLTLVGLTSLPGLTDALLAPAAYLVMATVQSNIVSPIVYGRGLNLNPVAILIAVILWGFLWGVPGAFLAVPMLAAGKVACDRVAGLRSVALFLEG
jgi:predicted PurR-regulated permease PerM